MQACLTLYCVTGFSFGCTKLTTLFALVCGGGEGGEQGSSSAVIGDISAPITAVLSTAWLAPLSSYT